MKLVTYREPNGASDRLGFIHDNLVVDVVRGATWAHTDGRGSDYANLPATLKKALENWETNFQRLQGLQKILSILELETLSIDGQPLAQPESAVTLLPPVPDPSTVRDFYAFEQHVRAARRLRGMEIHPDWFRLPVFYFTNPNALYGPGAEIPYPQKTAELDFELEFAVIIAQGGRDVPAAQAEALIGGYTIFNDWSARDLQREEMALNLGPAKGKDFATSVGPYMVTPDELADAWDQAGKLQLRMTCQVNGNLLSDGNTSGLYHSFPVMIERASLNATLLPGDYIGSGTVGTGCILELRPENTGGWLRKGDRVRMEVERLGVLENRVV